MLQLLTKGGSVKTFESFNMQEIAMREYRTRGAANMWLFCAIRGSEHIPLMSRAV